MDKTNELQAPCFKQDMKVNLRCVEALQACTLWSPLKIKQIHGTTCSKNNEKNKTLPLNQNLTCANYGIYVLTCVICDEEYVVSAMVISRFLLFILFKNTKPSKVIVWESDNLISSLIFQSLYSCSRRTRLLVFDILWLKYFRYLPNLCVVLFQPVFGIPSFFGIAQDSGVVTLRLLIYHCTMPWGFDQGWPKLNNTISIGSIFEVNRLMKKTFP